MSRYPNVSEASLGRPGSYVSASCGSLAQQRTSSICWTCVTKKSSLTGLMVNISIKDAGYLSVTALLNSIELCFYMFVSLHVSLLTLLAKVFIWVDMHLSCQAWQPLDQQLTWREWKLTITVSLKWCDGLSFTKARLSVTRSATIRTFVSAVSLCLYSSCLI